MKHIYILRALWVFSMAILLSGISSQTPASAQGGGPFNFIFAPDTPDDYTEKIYEELLSKIGPAFNLTSHWDPTFTATGDGGSNQGQALTLTWSIIPDGTFMPPQFSGDAGSVGCPSSLIADMNAKYGIGNWQNEIANVFADWASKTGNQYIFVASDDGAPWPTSPGQLGVRGDIRIGGCTIDGNSRILAYNFFPNNGDMKLDSKDSFFGGPTGGLTTGFHNIVSHEHGHGAGILHVCPINQTKLMEPFVSIAFKGLQHDDIRAVQRHYGDRNELINADNDIAARATDLGTPLNKVTMNVAQLSIDDNEDQDWFKFTVKGGSKVDVAITPVGFTYPDGDQFSGVCQTSGPIINSAAIHNLGFEIIDSDGVTVLSVGNASPAGLVETLTNISLGEAGPKYVRVFGDATNNIQLYDLQLTVKTGLSITKSASSGIVVTGQPLTYTVTITNTSFATHTNVVITDAVPANTTYMPGSASNGGNEAGGIVTWPTIAELGPNTSLTRTFAVNVATGLTNGSSITNTASVSASNISDVQPSNGVVTTVAAPVLSVALTSDPYPILADTPLITYTLTLQNSGDAPATGVVITNTIPASTTLVSASNGGAEASPGVIVWPPTSINIDTSITRTFKVNVTSPITDGNQLVNIISASSGQGTQIENLAQTQIVGLKFTYLPLLIKNN